MLTERPLVCVAAPGAAAEGGCEETGLQGWPACAELDAELELASGGSSGKQFPRIVLRALLMLQVTQIFFGSLQ